MNTLYLTLESDPQLDSILLATEDTATQLGLTIESSGLNLSVHAAQIYLTFGATLVTTIKVLFDLLQKEKSDLSPHELATLARTRIKEECNRIGHADFQIENLSIVEVDGSKVVQTVVHGPGLKAKVEVDELGNVTLTQVQ